MLGNARGGGVDGVASVGAARLGDFGEVWGGSAVGAVGEVGRWELGLGTSWLGKAGVGDVGGSCGRSECISPVVS